MATLLHDFRSEYRDRVLTVLWRQWTALGVAGTGKPWTASVIDPEALLLITCTVGRWDARLFDAALEWLRMNGRFVNVQRLRRMMRGEQFNGEAVLRAVAAGASTSSDELKWTKLAGRSPMTPTHLEPLFVREDGTPLPVAREKDGLFASRGFARDRFEPRGIAEEFRPEQGSTLLLRLRALLGLNARCEVLTYLLLNPVGSPRRIARDCYYSPAAISKVMAEMARSGFVAATTEGRHKRYRLVPDSWRHVFFESKAPPSWIVWPPALSALELVWLLLHSSDLAEQTPAEQASSLRRLLNKPPLSRLEGERREIVFEGQDAHTGEALIPFFIARMRRYLDWLDQPRAAW